MSTATLIMTPILAVVLLLVGLEIGRMAHGWLGSGSGARTAGEERVKIGLEDDKERLLLALRDLEFEFEMGKVSDEDYTSMRSRLEKEALEVIGALKSL
ncbi:MAG: hypothetical protein QF464_13110 [Myxococcota bacterium]|nr:hypothetical protein [Myxococcota bacterium]